MEQNTEFILTDIADTLISHRVAVKAQQKNFYCISPHRYTPDGSVFGGWARHAKPNPTSEDIEAYLKDGDAWPIAVTRELLALWLKKKHNLYAYTEKHFTTASPCLNFKPKILDWNTRTIKNIPDTFEQEELALDEALFIALDQIRK